MRSSALVWPVLPSGERDSADDQLRSAQPSPVELRDLALDRIRQGLCVFDGDQRLLLFNRQYAELYGLDPRQLWVGMTLRDVVDARYAACTGPDMTPEQYAAWRDRIGIAERVTDTEVILSNGRVHAIHHEPALAGGWVATFDDITERRQAEAQVRHMAHHDALTGLPNRAMLAECLERALARLRGDNRLEDAQPTPVFNCVIAVLFLDLDNFKDVNDTLGHAAGDDLLRLVAARVSGCLRTEDILARLGGDEFAVLLEGLAAERAAEVAQRVIDALSTAFVLNGHEALVGTSVGIAQCARSDKEIAEPDLLLRQADMALYQAKAEGRGTWRFFQAGMHAALQRRKEMERDLRRALAEGSGLEVHFQPIWALEPSQQLVGAEALARWNHPERGLVVPGEFIPLAESTGLIGELGAWVLRSACSHAARWNGLRVAVNLSPEQVRRPGLVDLVTSVLAETGLAADRLELEITEGLLLQHTAPALATLARLRALGVEIVLDDFGIGYSSLSYLRRFPFSKLKVDRSFVASMAVDAGTAAIVRAVAALGRSLGMRVCAEGVETEEQLSLVRAMGCNEAQGYLLGYPCPPAAFARLAASGQITNG